MSFPIGISVRHLLHRKKEIVIMKHHMKFFEDIYKDALSETNSLKVFGHFFSKKVSDEVKNWIMNRWCKWILQWQFCVLYSIHTTLWIQWHEIEACHAQRDIVAPYIKQFNICVLVFNGFDSLFRCLKLPDGKIRNFYIYR